MTLSGEEFHFKTLPDQGCSILKTDQEQGIATVEGCIAQKLQPVRTVAGTAASLAAAAAAAAASGKSAAPPLPCSLPNLPASLPAAPHSIVSPLDSQKEAPPPLPSSSSLEDPNTLNLLRNGLAEAAAMRGSVRLVLISLLAHRPTGLRTIKTKLNTLQECVSNFKYPQGKGDLEQMLKKVAAFKAPGNYVLFSGLEREIEHLVEEAEAIVKSDKEKAADKVRVNLAQSKAQEKQNQGGNRTREAVQQESSPAKVNKKKRPNAPSSLPTRTATPTLFTGTEEGLRNEDAEEPSVPPAARRKVTPSLTSEDGGTTTATATAASRPLSSSSRGSGGADESWVLEHAQRLPEPAPSITTATDYHTANAEFHRRYLVYFKLHQLLSANRRDFEALQAEVDDALSVQEKEKIEGEVERLWTRRANRSRRWEAAFRVLHEELAEWKNALSRYASSMTSSDNNENNTNNNNSRRNNAGGSAAAGWGGLSGLSEEEI